MSIKRKELIYMDNSSGSDIDIDLESGGAIWEEDKGKENVPSDENSKNLKGRISCGIHREAATRGSICNGDCSCSCERNSKSNEISSKETELQSSTFKKDLISGVSKSKDKEKSKKNHYAKPPRPPRGPTDVKVLKEITENNLKRKRIERLRTLKKMKKEKGSSFASNLFALLVTIIFLLVIFLQGTNFTKLKA